MGVELLRVENIVECRVVERLNRFVALVERNGLEKAHINNTGSLRGVLVKGRRGYCIPRRGGKTRYRLVAIECPGYHKAALIDTWLQMRGFEISVENNYLPWLRGCRVAKRNPRAGSSLLGLPPRVQRTRGLRRDKERDPPAPRGQGLLSGARKPAGQETRRGVNEASFTRHKGPTSLHSWYTRREGLQDKRGGRPTAPRATRERGKGRSNRESLVNDV